MSLVKALYDHVKKNPGKTSREISVGFDGYLMSHYFSRASVASTLSVLTKLGQLRRELPPGKKNGGKYFVDSYFDLDAYNKYFKDVYHAKIARSQTKAVPVHIAKTVDRDFLRSLTRKYARAYPYNAPNSQLVHQSLYDLCMALNVTVIGS
jgi:hypothetical protein